MKFKIYKHTSPSGKSYIGQTKDSVESRFWAGHVKHSNLNSPFRFHQAIRKYGPATFTTEILHECDTLDEALESEIKFIKEYNTQDYKHGYNMTPGGGGGFHQPHSEESKKRIGEAGKEEILGQKPIKKSGRKTSNV